MANEFPCLRQILEKAHCSWSETGPQRHDESISMSVNNRGGK